MKILIPSQLKQVQGGHLASPYKHMKIQQEIMVICMLLVGSGYLLWHYLWQESN